MARNVAGYIKAAGRYMKDVSEVGQRGGGVVNGVRDTVLAGPRAVSNMTGDALVKTAKGMTKKTDPSVMNLWTGRRESGLAIGTAVVAGAAYAGYSGFKQTRLAPKVGTVSYGGTAPIMDADGVGNTPQAPITNAPTLSASGQMVFGLHQARKG